MAEELDIDAMEDYVFAKNGFSRDEDSWEEAYEWATKGHDAGSLLGTAARGAFLVEKGNEKLGLVYLGIAAGKGSKVAALMLCMLESHFSTVERERLVDMSGARPVLALLEDTNSENDEVQVLGELIKQDKSSYRRSG